ncbi:MAG: TonB family protein, partial [Candidatus Omnitrophota bacterium]
IMTLYKGNVKAIAVDNPTRVAIGNPAVCDIASINKTEMVISAKEQGTTSLIWQDAQGLHTLQLEVFLENMSFIRQHIDSMLKELNLPNVTTRNMDSEGKIMILGDVKTSQDVERINVGLGSLKAKTINLVQVKEEETVVGIDVQVLELNKDATDTLGFSWPGTTTITEVGSPALLAAGTTWGKLFTVTNVSRSAFTLTLDALVQEGKARVLSQPRLSCQSGKEAELMVGGEKPILTTTVAATTGATGTSVDYKEFGIKLKIKPVVTEDKKIKLALNVEVSEVGTADILGTTADPTAKAYPLTKRNASTELFLKDGQTMAIGGLKKQKTEEDIRKTPFLGNIPFLGAAFRKRTTKIGGGTGEKGDVELFITLTPTIVKEHVVKDDIVTAAPEEKETPAKKEENPDTGKDKVKSEIDAITKEAKAKKENVIQQPAPVPEPAQIKTSPISEYVNQVSQQIGQNLAYPWAAKQAEIEGSVRLALRVYRTGKLMDIEIKKSSGSALLDQNAVDTIKKVAPFSPFPPEMKQKELWIDLPVVYKTQ